MVVYKATVCTALTDVANLKAAQKVSKMNGLRYELSDCSLETFPSIHMLEILDLQNAIAKVYSDKKAAAVDHGLTWHDVNMRV